MTYILTFTILVGRTIPTCPIGVILFYFSKVVLGPFLLVSKDLTSLHKLHTKSNLEAMLESVLLVQQKQDDCIKKLASEVDFVTTHNKVVESQIAQQVSTFSMPQGRLPSKPEPNSKEHCNCIVLRSGKQLEGLKGARVEENGEKNHDVHVDALPTEDNPQKKSASEKLRESKLLSSKPYMSPLPFP